MEDSKEQDNENFDKIKVFSSEDEKLKLLGELLSNKSSRDIIKLLIDKEMYINEIAKKLELKVSLVIHHLQKMEAIGLLEIIHKKIARKGEEHRFFRIPTGMLILPKKSEEDANNGFLKKIFKESVKFLSLGIIAALSYAFLNIEKTIDETGDQYLSSDEIINSTDFEPLNIPLIIVIIGLCVIYLLEKKKR